MTAQQPRFRRARLLLALVFMLISLALALIDIYNRYSPPQVDNLNKTKIDRDYSDAPLRSGTKQKSLGSESTK
jgi:hypothetical protein